MPTKAVFANPCTTWSLLLQRAMIVNLSILPSYWVIN